MLKNKLYRFASLEEQKAGSYRAQIILDPSHAIFKGHFPSQPILPGVCMLEILKEMVREIKDKPLDLKKGATIKYLKIVDPTVDPHLTLDIQLTEEAAGLKVDASSYLQDGSSNFKMKGIFA